MAGTDIPRLSHSQVIVPYSRRSDVTLVALVAVILMLEGKVSHFVRGEGPQVHGPRAFPDFSRGRHQD